MVNVTSLTAAWSDNMRLDQLNAAIKVNSTSISTAQGTDTQRFWATPDRFADDDADETMEITLSNERLVNHITFDLAKFPHDCRLEYFDVSIGDWRALLRDSDRDEDCYHGIDECSPPVLPPISSINGHYHPQHSYSGHWEPCEFLCRPVRFQRIRVVLRRHTRSRRPCNSRGIEVAFSLAVRGLYCGYKVYSRACIPTPQPVLTSYTEHQEFATTTDVLGSQVSYSYRVNRASNILLNDPNAPGDTLVWKSEPQPFPYAVVNYFMDVRDGSGNPQLIDRFYLDPLYEGANVNLYYSNDEPEDDFEAPDDPLPPQVAVVNGPTSGTNPLGSDSQPYGRVTWVDIDNTPLCFRPGRRWWFGGRLNWKFLRSIDILDHPIFDCGEFHLAWTRYGMRFASRGGDYFYVDVDNFQPAQDFTFMSWYEGGRAYIRIRVNGQDYGGNRGLSVALSEATISKMRVAGFFTNNVSADFKLKHMVLKVDQFVTEDLISDFFNNPQPYCVKPEFSSLNDGRTNNAILRYNPGFVTDDFPTGLKGGTPTKYSNMEWSPIARDYTMAKGFLYFPPTKAKYWKLEFCGLTPEPYEVYVPIKKTVKTYRTEMWLVPVSPPTLSASISIMVPGLSVQIGVSASLSFRSSTSVKVNASSTSISIKGYSSTSIRVVTNVQARVALTSVSWVWGFLPCHPPIYVPRFETKCVHEYDEIEIQSTEKIAYFVGLKGIQAYKVDYLAVDDTSQYSELFQDTSNIDSESGWTLTNDHELTSGDARFAQAQSKIMSSSRIVRAVQFATTQSAPIQLLPDDDFDAGDPEDNWRAVGDGTLAPFTTVDERVGSILRIDRGSRAPSQSEMISIFPLWSSFEAQAATWSAVELSGNPAQASGGIESLAPASTPPGGRVYAAARVVAPADLSSPLYVQIIDDETGAVLSETGTDVKANQITEWYTGYTIGEGGSILAWRWRDFSTNPAYPTYIDNFQRSNATSLGALTTNQNWLNDGVNIHQLSSNQALTTVAGQFDWVDSITPWGIYEVVVGTLGSGGTDKLFDLLPIRLDDQGVLSHTSGRSALPTGSVLNRAVMAGDDIRIDVLPTVQVPVNRRAADWLDNVQAPYSLVIYLNGTWIKTIGHRAGARTRRGILGKVNQRFSSFSWLPVSFGALPGRVIHELPVVGQGSFDVPRLTWTSAIERTIWALTGTVDNSTTAGVLTFTSAGGQMLTDTGYWYGTLAAGVRKIAAGTVGRHGNVFVLDADNSVYLNAAGNVIGNGINYGNLIPGGVADNTHVAVQFLDTKSVAAGSRTGIDPNVYPKMIAGIVNGSYVGKLAFADLQGWQGTRRGLAGDVFDGTPGTPIADFHTSFDGFGWAPDASNTPTDPKTPKWDEISQKGTGTYDSLARYQQLNMGKLRARVVQRGASIDVWDMDTLSLFANPIAWSFSNDGGLTFYNAFDIRNNPEGVFVFPDSVQLTASQVSSSGAQAGSNPGQSLVWRVISYAPNQKISSLTIRPWYGGLLSGITHRVGLATGGPNDMPYDHYPPIEQDARFQTWHKPIPADWWYQFRILKRSVDEVVPPPKVLLLPEALTSKYKNEV